MWLPNSKSFPFSMKTLYRMQNDPPFTPTLHDTCIKCCARFQDGQLIRFWIPTGISHPPSTRYTNGATNAWLNDKDEPKFPSLRELGHVHCPGLRI
jgi:hypothetical protein